MDDRKIVESLQTLTGDPLLREFAHSGLALIQGAASIRIVNGGNNSAVDRQSLLSTYLLRQRRLAETRTVIPGFDATIASLAKQTCERIILIVVHIGPNSMALFFQPSGEIVGGFIGNGSVDVTR